MRGLKNVFVPEKPGNFLTTLATVRSETIPAPLNQFITMIPSSYTSAPNFESQSQRNLSLFPFDTKLPTSFV
jgi:hypothetical protein